MVVVGEHFSTASLILLAWKQMNAVWGKSINKAPHNPFHAAAVLFAGYLEKLIRLGD